MKRNLAIAAITMAALIGGGTYTAVAMGDDDSRGAGTATLPTPVAKLGTVPDDSGNDILDDSQNGGKDSGKDDRRDDRAPEKRQPAAGSGTGLTASEAAAVALKEYPGAVASVERDDDGDRHWEIDLFGKDNRWHELRVDAANGTVRVDRDDDGDDDHGDDRATLRAASVDVRRATAAALASVPGAVTSAEIDDDHNGRWEIDVRGKDGRTHELNVHARTGKVTVDSDDDRWDDNGRGDDDSRDDDGQDDRDDHDARDDDGYDD
ncbi:PepSY domain-containing protein [Streptomyces sp. 35G-GA-8]|uniref:PepSY domain-containing protein n=1 Tax=Streptomyces sp. 35G-GA-8 TaxID=2939434 RepID=UPI00201EDA35|nr:PepSY domain-containing protein [Streptomyces sp. 35G-GA-8]MCL7381566.1 PepSY domain-containing protein [Streptomyces sp. 35G-GA-8]